MLCSVRERNPSLWDSCHPSKGLKAVLASQRQRNVKCNLALSRVKWSSSFISIPQSVSDPFYCMTCPKAQHRSDLKLIFQHPSSHLKGFSLLIHWEKMYHLFCYSLLFYSFLCRVPEDVVWVDRDGRTFWYILGKYRGGVFHQCL